MKKSNIVIAIDGPVGSGKGTLAIALSKELGIIYLYTGRMYRALALACLRQEVDLTDEEKVLAVLLTCNLRLDVSSEGTLVFLGKEDVTNLLVQTEVSNSVFIVSAHPKVRQEMVRRQQSIIAGQSAVVEGRDSASVVAPNADLKIFLTANLETRAKRRYAQLSSKDSSLSVEEVLQDIKKRDKADSERSASPLSKASDAVVIDTTKDTVEQTVARVNQLLKERQLI